jgi:hypothetical protein
MANLVKDLQSTNEFFRKDAERVANQLRNEATITNGIIRWDSNNAVPPTDCLELAVHIGLAVDLLACKRAAAEDLAAFLTLCGKQATVSDKNDAEARAEFGPGVTLVNVATGRVWTT